MYCLVFQVTIYHKLCGYSATGFLSLPILPHLPGNINTISHISIKLLPLVGCLEIVPCLVGILNDLSVTNRICKIVA